MASYIVGMEFETWLSDRPRAEVATALGVHRMTLNRYARGQIMPRPPMVEAIGRLTGGAVSVVDLATSYSRYWAARQ